MSTKSQPVFFGSDEENMWGGLLTNVTMGTEAVRARVDLEHVWSGFKTTNCTDCNGRVIDSVNSNTFSRIDDTLYDADIDFTTYSGYNATEDLTMDIGSITDFSFLAVTQVDSGRDDKTFGLLGLGRNNAENQYINPSFPT